MECCLVCYYVYGRHACFVCEQDRVNCRGCSSITCDVMLITATFHMQGVRIVFFTKSANVPDVSNRLNNEIGEVCNILCLAMLEIMHEGYSAPGGFCIYSGLVTA